MTYSDNSVVFLDEIRFSWQSMLPEMLEIWPERLPKFVCTWYILIIAHDDDDDCWPIGQRINSSIILLLVWIEFHGSWEVYSSSKKKSFY